MIRKNIILFLSLGLLSFSLVSCDKFLEKTDKDLLIPETVDQYRQILRGDAYSSDYQTYFNWIHYMDDDIEMQITSLTGNTSSQVETYRGVFQWKKELETEMGRPDRAFGRAYEYILACNVIINAEDMQGQEADKNLLLAQAYTLRAYYYFTLVNLYAKPYNAGTASTDPGVSIWLDSKPTLERLPRSSVAETYALINQDIETALELFKTANVPNNNFEITEEATLLLASRVALFQEDFDRVIDYGTSLMKKKSQLHDLTSGDITFDEDTYSFISQVSNPEILFNFGNVRSSYDYLLSISSTNSGPFFQVSQTVDGNLLSTYEAEDQRMLAFFDETVQYFPIKYSRTPSNAKGEAWRTAEVYLNMAEAYARKSSPEPSQALELYNTLRRNRILNYVDASEADFTSNTELIEAIWAERRRELCFEECHRWWDLRRQGMPELIHTAVFAGGTTENYKLEQGDANYTLEIPRAERDYNPGIELNNRVEKNPVN